MDVRGETTHRLLGLNGVDMDLRSGIGEVGIEIEYVLVSYILADWSFLQYFLVPASQTLQSSPQLFLLCRITQYINPYCT